MKKENDFYWGYVTVIIFVMFFGIVIIPLMTQLQTERDKAYNTIAELKCPMMQYRTTETYSCLKIEDYTGILQYCRDTCKTLQALFDYSCKKLNDTIACEYSIIDCFVECDKKYTVNTTCYNDIYKNFTTGRYIDGKIECQAPTDICMVQATFTKCYDAQAKEIDCPFICDEYDVKSQNFTLEEMGV